MDVPSADISVIVPLTGSTKISASISPDSVSSLAEALTKMFCLVSDDTEYANFGPSVPLIAYYHIAICAVAPAASGIFAILILRIQNRYSLVVQYGSIKCHPPLYRLQAPVFSFSHHSYIVVKSYRRKYRLRTSRI